MPEKEARISQEKYRTDEGIRINEEAAEWVQADIKHS